jgi:poly-gamma-glutamate synthesis protein (capsule biosynthesis protein)
MISRTDRHRKAAARRKQRVRRLAAHLAAIGFSALVLFAGAYFIWTHDAKRNDAGDAGGPVTDRPPAATDGPDTGSGTIPAGLDGTPAGGRENGGMADPDGAGSEGEPSVRLLFVGDIMMGGRVGELLEREGYDYPYRHVGAALREADLAVGNLENPITDRGEPADKTWTFRMSPLAVPALKESGFDVLSLANNHVLDYGTDGLLDTIRHLDEAGIGRVGGGNDADEAYLPYYTEVQGIRIACLGFSHVVPEVGWKAGKNHPGVADMYDTRRAVETIKAVRENADLVVVMVHWGIERAEEPEPYQVKKGREFIDAGADLVIGSHPHVLQGIESYKGKWIAYSLGNFIFTVSGNADTRQSAMLQADCRKDGDCRLTLIPVVTGPGQPYYPDEEGAASILDRLNRLSYQVRVNDDGLVVADPAGRVYDPEKAARKKPADPGTSAGDAGGEPTADDTGSGPKSGDAAGGITENNGNGGGNGDSDGGAGGTGSDAPQPDRPDQPPVDGETGTNGPVPGNSEAKVPGSGAGSDAGSGTGGTDHREPPAGHGGLPLPDAAGPGGGLPDGGTVLPGFPVDLDALY